MSEAADIVRELFDRFEGSLAPLADLFSEDVEIRGFRWALEGTAYRGPEAPCAFDEGVREAWSELEVGDFEFEDRGGGDVLVRGHLQLKSRDSGIVLDDDCWWVVSVRDGLVTRFFISPDEREAQAFLERR